MLKKRLPPLEPLIAFEAAARLLSFTRASEELHLTQAAVSQQIRNLEQNLQTKLFIRSHRAVQLTDEGREYQHSISAMLNQLASATTDIKSVEINTRLSIACDQSFAALWLSPRLRLFRSRYPDIALRLIVSDDDAECTMGDIQLSVLHGDGNWPGYQSYRLFDEEVFPVCSPDYENGRCRDDWSDWLLHADLLDLEDSHWNWMNWRVWFSGNGIDEALHFRHLQINNYPLLIEAARQSQGVVLGWRYLIDDCLTRGELVRPVPQSLVTDYAYYLIINHRYAGEDSVICFRDWLINQFSQHQKI